MSILQENKKIYDISVPLDKNIPIWPNSFGFKSRRIMKMENGDCYNNTIIETDVHCGTHIDAPWHFISNGKKTIEISLSDLIGECHVVEIKNIDRIFAKHLNDAKIPNNTKRLILHTDNSELWQKELFFHKNFCALNECAAKWIVEHGIKLVGIDYLSIQKYNDGPEVHQILLKNKIIILEGLNLTNIVPKKYELICLPLAVNDVDGIGARAILRDLG